MNWKLRKAFTGNNTSDVQTINGYIAAGEDNDFSVEVSPVGKEYPAPLVVPRTNLLLQSNTFDTTWVLNSATLTSGQSGYDGTNDAWLLNSTSTSFSIYQDYNQVGVSTFSIYAKQGTLSQFTLDVFTSAGTNAQVFNLSTGSLGSASGNVISADITDVGGGWYRCGVTTNNTGTVYYARVVTGVGTIYIQDAQLEAGDKATEYIPTTTEVVTRSWDSFSRVQNQVPGICNGIHTHTGAASGGGIAATTLTGTGSGGKFKYEFDTLGKLTLIEAMTHENLLLQSNTFDTTWSTVNASVTSGESGYDGSSDAWLLGSTGGSNGRLVQSISQGGVQTLSFYAKAGTYSFARPLGLDSSTNPDAFFDLSTGTIASVDPACDDAQMEDVGGGWYRCSITYNTTISEARIYPAFADGDTSTFGGNIYIQDAQLEEGSQATGYIETTTAPVREGAGQGYRVDDKLSITTNEGHDIEFRLVEGSNATTVTVGMEATKPSKPVPFPVTKMRVADSTDRQVLIMDQRSRYVFPKPTPYLLDTYEGAAAAYSLRRLRSAYTGPAVRVRRASNNDELDIYFDGQGNLDTASLEAFCAGTNGFVKVWYDQGPGGNNSEQTVTANQPKIVSSGSVITENGKPALEFDGSSDYLQTSAISALDTDVQSSFNVATDDSGDTSTRFVWRSSYTSGAAALSNVLTGIFKSSVIGFHARTSTGTYKGVANALPTNQGLISTVWNSSDVVSGKLNGVDFTANNDPGADAVPSGHNFTRIGANTSGADFYWQGTMQEIILYPSDETSNRAGIETNINDYYNIY